MDLPAPTPEIRDRLSRDPQPQKTTRVDDIGGDDVPFFNAEHSYDSDMAVASDGDLFAIMNYDNGDGLYRIVIHRSDDGGTTWRQWALLDGSLLGYRYWNPVIHVAEGTEDRCFIAYSLDLDYTGPSEMHVAWSPLDLEYGDFSNDTVLYTEPLDIFSPSFTTDAGSYDAYYCYLVFRADDTDGGSDIHFARSTDQGTSWETPYKIGSISVSDRGYYHPQVVYGYGGYVHVAWFLGFFYPHEFEGAIRYRRATSYADGGLSAWNTMQSITSHANDLQERSPQIAASRVSPDVLIAWDRREVQPDGSSDADGVGTIASGDSGDTWDDQTDFGSNNDWLGEALHQDTAGRWILGLSDGNAEGIRWAPLSSPADWSAFLAFEDENNVSGEPPLILDPSHDDRIGILGGGYEYDGSFTYYFDAEWRADTGYPNLEPGFPIGLWAPPLSPPAVVDVDGDGDLEIVFSDELRQIQVINHDGSYVPGWPVDVGVDLSDGPVAVGDLNEDGHPILVVGGSDGNAYAYDHTGNLLPGWPSAITPPGHDIYVSIGAVGPPYPRSVVCAGANYITLRNSRGVAPPHTVGWSTGSDTYAAPAAIGDIDFDGTAEIVGGLGATVFAIEKGATSREFIVTLPSTLSDALTLADLDQYSDMEILCPTASGVLYVLDHTGAQLGGNFPYDSGTVASLTSVAAAQCLGTYEPEIAFANRNWTVHTLYGDGTSAPGYPHETSSGWYLYGAPIIGRVDGTSSDVVIGDRGDRGWAWNNLGVLVPGWPKLLLDQSNLSPAMGDVDLDGSNEIVMLTDTQIFLVDVNNTVNDVYRTWAMYGHDPQRTGCSDCWEDLTTAVDPDEPGGVTRVSFAGPSPNPVSGHTQFAFAVPLRAAVNLEIIDLRGRRVYTVHREEMDAGSRVVAWHGKDADGEPVASGQYFARLRVRGPGLDQMLTRKVVVVR